MLVVIGGTSANSPAFASVFNRTNEERIAAGKSTVGSVNLTMDTVRQVLHEITVGDRRGCGTCGFAVETGRDPVTGLSASNYPAMSLEMKINRMHNIE